MSENATPTAAIPPPLMTKRQVAELLQYSTRTIDRMVSAGLLPKLKLGKRSVRFRRRDVLPLLEGADE